MNGDGKRRITMNNSKIFRTESRCGNDNYNDVPSWVKFSIDEATAAEIIRLAALVRSNGLYKIEKFDCRAQYLKYDPDQDPEDAKLAGEGNEFRTEAAVLNISDDEFWFSAYIRYTDIEILSEQQLIGDLLEHFVFERPTASLY
jgi:hypothetical protein